MAGIPFDDLHSFLQAAGSVQIRKQFFVAKSLHGDQASVISVFFQPADFLHQPLFHHPVHSPVDPFIQPCPVIIQHEISVRIGGLFFLLLFIVKGDRLSGLLIKFQRTDHAFDVVGMDRQHLHLNL